MTDREDSELPFRRKQDEPGRWIFTFGHGHEHFGTYVAIQAACSDDARAAMFRHFGEKWCMQYDDEKAAGVERWELKLLRYINTQAPSVARPTTITVADESTPWLPRIGYRE